MDPIDFTTVVFVPSFILFVFLMNMVFFKPVAKVIEERDHTLSSDKDKTQKAISTAETKVKEYEEALADARHAASEILAKATEGAHDQQNKMIMETDKELRAKKADALKGLDAEKQSLVSGLNSTISELTKSMVGKVLDQEVKVDLSDKDIQSAFLNGGQRKDKVEVGV